MRFFCQFYRLLPTFFPDHANRPFRDVFPITPPPARTRALSVAIACEDPVVPFFLCALLVRFFSFSDRRPVSPPSLSIPNIEFAPSWRKWLFLFQILSVRFSLPLLDPNIVFLTDFFSPPPPVLAGQFFRTSPLSLENIFFFTTFFPCSTSCPFFLFPPPPYCHNAFSPCPAASSYWRGNW